MMKEFDANRGLSPRMRGNPDHSTRTSADLGSIPAHAGEPLMLPADCGLIGVYPRACGGTSRSCPVCPLTKGLSPRMRGNRLPAVPLPAQYGSIPAHAGEPRNRTGGPITRWVYPRACGGTIDMDRDTRWIKGLSPGMRGNRPGKRPSATGTGSIPAHAGEPRTWGPRLPCTTVYPRACGGTQSLRQALSVLKGLSPRMRGNQVRTDGMVYEDGSIPAHAGEPVQRPRT